MKKSLQFIGILLLFIVSKATAHPHAFIEMKAAPLVKNEQLVGFSMQWTLDEVSSSEILYDFMLVEDDQKAKQKMFDEMIKNVVNEHYFSYFYDDKGRKIKYTSTPQNYGLRAVRQQIQYYFDFMLTNPQPLTKAKYILSTYDPTYYVSMYYNLPPDHKKTQSAVDFTALPSQCKGEVRMPNVDKKTQDYAASLDQTQRDDDPTLGAIFAQEVIILCD
ncbi:ABC-type uncharacterized transport system substrate-binding protein [Cricetibacter osteomyelitidis]|uniref:ABC-type uncharacterized transport system substrate-binding protein n=1 Tax=Cricetibacter osteomyelitidis TaxID=1521931 RepID=A0A4R2T0F6_9PAST|nr:DUF1007 family protein [Cricetibacter osteomyelitidis]TCP95345.1 ABC-type uncharacterized transport system substrate-binding protein [Cricetibacter osteomyelitidis]